ncbi:MAG: hypothetical protein M3Y91_14895 [Actinomycetota bacterium]|nr:hypothetical protein [Actinomycetota bacterium]
MTDSTVPSTVPTNDEARADHADIFNGLRSLKDQLVASGVDAVMAANTRFTPGQEIHQGDLPGFDGFHSGHGRSVAWKGVRNGWATVACNCGEMVFLTPNANAFDIESVLIRDIPVGVVEVAHRLRVTRDDVNNWRRRDQFPPPNWTVGGRPAWRWSTIDAWAQATGRLREHSTSVDVSTHHIIGESNGPSHLYPHLGAAETACGIPIPSGLFDMSADHGWSEPCYGTVHCPACIAKLPPAARPPTASQRARDAQLAEYNRGRLAANG